MPDELSRVGPIIRRRSGLPSRNGVDHVRRRLRLVRLTQASDEAGMDDFLDDVEDLLDPTTAAGVAFIGGSGLLDDDGDDRDADGEDRHADGERCTCWCGCRRRAPWGEDECRRCQADRHRDDR